ncbi:MAG: ATP-binding protein [Thermoplasmata archaeon]
MAVLMASLSSTNRHEQLNVKYVYGEKAIKALERALNLEYRGKTTQLLPSEAAPLFHISSIEMAIEPTSPASFSTSRMGRRTPSEQSDEISFYPGEIILGSTYRSGTLDSDRIKKLALEDLKHHVFIGGKTGTGKSTTKNRIIIDAWKNGVPSLILEPAKADARGLMGAISDLYLFTMGQEKVAPLRINPFWVEEGVSPQLHMGHLYSCFMAAWPVYGMLANHMRRVLKDIYENNGWDFIDEKRGARITLDLFLTEAEVYCTNRLGYGSELSQDFTGAIIARAEDLCDASRAVIFNTTNDLPMEELLSKPTIIEMEHLGDPEFTAFSLILIRIIEHFKKLGTCDKLRCLLVVDEAHRVLEEVPKPVDDNEAASAKRKAVDLLVNLIAEARSYGLGIVLVEQIPTRLSRNAIKNCHTKIVHRLTSPDDIELMAAETSCDKQQKAHISALKTGEAVVADPSSIVPNNVQIFYDPDFCPSMKRRWTDDDVRERMRSFYETHPGFAKRPEIPVLRRRKSHDLEENAVSMAIQLDDVIRTSAFQKVLRETVAETERDSKSEALEELFAHYALHLGHFSGSALDVALIIAELVEAAYGLLPRHPNPRTIQRLISEISPEEGMIVGRDRPAP